MNRVEGWIGMVAVAALAVGAAFVAPKMMWPSYEKTGIETGKAAGKEVVSTLKPELDALKPGAPAAALTEEKVAKIVKDEIGNLAKKLPAVSGAPAGKAAPAPGPGVMFVSETYEVGKERIATTIKADLMRIKTSEDYLRAVHNRQKNEHKRKGMSLEKLDELDKNFEKLMQDRRVDRAQSLLNHETELLDINEQRKEVP